MIRHTGLGSLGETDFATASRFVLDQAWPWFPELPSVANMIDRAVGLLAMPWPGQAKARGQLRADLDEFESVAYDYSGPLKVSVCGPWTLAAALTLPRGQKVLSDQGARRDLGQALVAGVDDFLANLQRRIPKAQLTLQCDEPGLPAVQAGRIPNASGLFQYRAIDQPELAAALTPWPKLAPAVLHCCAPRLDVALVTSCGFDVSGPWSMISPADAALVFETGHSIFLGVADDKSPDRCAQELVEWLTETGGTGEQLVLTPVCGQAELPVSAAMAELTWLRETCEELSDRLA